jgi:hypothetical protein
MFVVQVTGCHYTNSHGAKTAQHISLMSSLTKQVDHMTLCRFEHVQGILTEGDGLVQLTSLYQLNKIGCIWYSNHYLIFCKTNYLNEEVKRTEPSPSVSVPWSMRQSGEVSLRRCTQFVRTLHLRWRNQFSKTLLFSPLRAPFNVHL